MKADADVREGGGADPDRTRRPPGSLTERIVDALSIGGNRRSLSSQ
jgi:hypothetical protein